MVERIDALEKQQPKAKPKSRPRKKVRAITINPELSGLE